MRMSDCSSDVGSSDLFSGQRVRVYIDRTAGQTVELTAGLFACDPLAARATVITDRCILLVQGDGTGNTITLGPFTGDVPRNRSEEHTSELQSLMRISYAVFCLKKKKQKINKHT